jgi:phosphate uptake regulator
MEIQQYIPVLRSQLLEMSRLSQRAVDYSIKAYELGSPEFCRHVCNTEYKFGELHRCLADRCRKYLKVGLPIDPDARFVGFVLRICSTLHAIHSAATEVARNTMLFLESGHVQESLALEQMGNFVNRLVRLCTVALNKGEAKNAKTVLRNHEVGRWFELIVYQTDSDIRQWIGAQATFELAIAKSLGEIANQAHKMAGAITVWLEEKGRIDATCERAAYVHPESLPMREDEERDQIELSVAGEGYFRSSLA